MLISIEKKAPADPADLRRSCAEIICIPSVALCAFSVALCVTTVFFYSTKGTKQTRKARSFFSFRSRKIFISIEKKAPAEVRRKFIRFIKLIKLIRRFEDSKIDERFRNL